MRTRYCVTSSRDVSRLSAIAFCMSGIVASTTLKGGVADLFSAPTLQAAVQAAMKGATQARQESRMRFMAAHSIRTGLRDERELRLSGDALGRPGEQRAAAEGA